MNLLHYTRDLARKSIDISLTLFKLMVPIIIVMKVLEELGLDYELEVLALPLGSGDRPAQPYPDRPYRSHTRHRRCM